MTGHRRVRTPTVLQMEAVECGAAALAIVLGYFGRVVPLEEMRVECGVSRDGSKASNIQKAAKRFGLVAKGKQIFGVERLKQLSLPLIVFWNFNHFLVVEGFGRKWVYLNDPGSGPRKVTYDEFNESFTGIALTFEPGPDFETGGRPPQAWKLLGEKLRESKVAVAFALFAGLALVVPGLAIPTFSKIFVDELLISGRDDWINPFLWAMVFTILIQVALVWLQQHYLARLQLKLALAMSGRYLWHVLRLPLVFFTQRSGGEVGTRVLANDRLAILLSGELASNAVNLVTMLFFFLIMLQYDVLLTAIGTSFALLNVVMLRWVARYRKDVNRRVLQDQAKLMATSMGGMQIIETIKASGLEGDFFNRWAGFFAKKFNGDQKLELPTQLMAAIPNLLNALNAALILSVGAFRVMDGQLTIGSLVAFQALMAGFMLPINNLVNLGSQMQEVEGDLARLDDVLKYDIDPAIRREEAGDREPGDAGPGGGKLDGDLELRDVTFGYSPLEAPLIENFNLRLKPGQRVALVGPSGCGKSTVLRLITGLYAPWSGQVLFDGRPREAVPRAALSASLAMVDQDIFLFDGTVRENITLWDGTVPSKDVIQAGRDACIHDDITARQSGYDSPVSEGGANFSGGQRQRLEIARSLAGGPRILLLDEATSALDALTEQQVDLHLRRRGITTLIVAHRLSTIRDCDEIIVMDKGKIVERGTHDDLMAASNGAYAHLVEN